MCANVRLTENGFAESKIFQNFCKIGAIHKLQGLHMFCPLGTSCIQTKTGWETNKSKIL
jgi:hypothetical protein